MSSNNLPPVKDDAYFQSYTDVEVHRLMLSDVPRTSTYQKVIANNAEYFKGKSVLDVGAGTGILSIFCARAGARKVYAVEASQTAQQIKEVVQRNQLQEVIEVFHSRVEDVVLPEKVDIIVSEWMGFYLLHESMLESVLIARDKYLDDEGIILPSHAVIYTAPVSMESYVKERIDFWDSVYDIDMTPFKEVVLNQQKSTCQPEIMCIEPDQLLGEPQVVAEFDLRWLDTSELIKIMKRVFLSVTKDGPLQGICIWFDVSFRPNVYGESVFREEFTLQTGPGHPPTHWKQTVLILPKDNNSDSYEKVEVDDIIGWDLKLAKSESNDRHYVIEASILDPASDEHPVPCGCLSAKCALIKAFEAQLEQSEGFC